ncbi:hypothetical protein M422DRAFT_184445 [Sphaerobolus stellatus SS14]|uniref:FAD dependent oxidoreductase domain-containing protein n=1 Tax=Sphaerobolus stellatus (strain SS14) TaxID=990650 RepID=A0A0C9TQS1_SPHS4|nr:hypothetical protein M422DRAFT_184445 [Sphaerobolus stellatus SS14]
MAQIPLIPNQDFKSSIPVPLHQHITEERLFAAFSRDSVPLPYPNPTKAFWTHGEPDANPLGKVGSVGNLTANADVVIIGSGITGVGAAYHLAKLAQQAGLKLDVVVLEARDFCNPPQGRNGGHLTPVLSQGFRANSQRYGVVEAIKSVALENHTVSSLLHIIRSNNKEEDVDLVSGHRFDLFFSKEEENDFLLDYDAAKMSGVNLSDIRFLSQDETRNKYGPQFPSVSYFGNNLWPLKLVTQLFNLAKERFSLTSGSHLSLHTQTPVTKVSLLSESDRGEQDDNRYPRRWLIETPRGLIRSHIVIHATNAYAAHLLPFLIPSPGKDSIVPVRGQVIATRAAISSQEIINTSSSANDGFEYWFSRPIKNVDEDKPLIILGGAREATAPGFELGVADDTTLNENASKTLRDFLPAVYPEGWFSKDQQPEMEWTGVMGFTESRNPFVGPVIDPSTKTTIEGQYIAAGYSGHGMPRTFGCAEALAQIIIADLTNKTWTSPKWFPQHFLTTSR